MEILNPEENINPEQLLFFFNVGHECSFEFKPFGNPAESEYNFYWFHDRYYNHQSVEHQPKYLHLFIEPEHKIHPRWFRSDIGENTIENAYKYYLGTDGVVEGSGVEPAILRCSATFTPSIVFEFDTEGSNTATAIFPDKLKGHSFEFFTKEHKAIPFIDIEGLVELVPALKKAVPIVPLC